MTGEEGLQLLFQPPLWAAGGYLRPYFGATKLGPWIIRRGGIRAATDRDCPLIYGLLDIMAVLHYQSKNIIHSASRAYFGSGWVLGAFATVLGSWTRCSGVDDRPRCLEIPDFGTGRRKAPDLRLGSGLGSVRGCPVWVERWPGLWTQCPHNPSSVPNLWRAFPREVERHADGC